MENWEESRNDAISGDGDLIQNAGVADSRPQVLVLMATYNGCQWIEQQVSSILAQRAARIQLVIGDDCSSDGIVELLQRQYSEDSRVVIRSFSTPSGSAGSNFRRLMSDTHIGSADYVAFADQDDVWFPEKLARAIETMKRARADGYSSSVEAFWTDGRTTRLDQCATLRAADFLFEGAGQGCTFVMSSRLLSEVAEFCRSHRSEAGALHYHDWLTYLLARAKGYGWVFDPTITMQYRQHSVNEIGARSGFVGLRRRLGLIRSGWYRSQLRAASKIYLCAGGEEPRAVQLARRLEKEGTRTLLQRVQLSVAVLRWGRRRLSDRIVLAVCSLAGWV